MKERFLGNLGGKKLHALDYADGRCKISGIKEENAFCLIRWKRAWPFQQQKSRSSGNVVSVSKNTKTS